MIAATREEEQPTTADIIEALNRGCRYLPRLAAEGSKEAQEFYALGDAITVNEGDFWLLLMFASFAAERLKKFTETPAVGG